MGMNASATKLTTLVLPIVVFATAVSVATAQTAAPGDVVKRQDGMKAMANGAKSINSMFKDTSPYDAKAFQATAETIRAHSGAALSPLFNGSDTTAGSKPAQASKPNANSSTSWQTILASTRPRCLSQLTEIPMLSAPKRECRGRGYGRRTARKKGGCGERCSINARRACFSHDASNLHVVSRQVPDRGQVAESQRVSVSVIGSRTVASESVQLLAFHQVSERRSGLLFPRCLQQLS